MMLTLACPKNLIQTSRSKLEKSVVLQHPDFKAYSVAESCGVGMHSYWKFRLNEEYAINKGASPDDVEIRG